MVRLVYGKLISLTNISCVPLAGIIFLLSAIAAPAIPAGEPAKRALLVAVTGYKRQSLAEADRLEELNTEPDVAAVKDVLIKRFGFKDEDVHVLVRPKDTTHNNIVKQFREYLVARTKPGDIVYFHFSGHGCQLADPSNKELGGRETIVPSDYVSADDRSNDITDYEFGDLLTELSKCHPRNVTVSLDCCHSGTLTRGGRFLVRGKGHRRAGARGSVDSTVPSGKAFADEQGLGPAFAILSACDSHEVATETDGPGGKPMGLFSYHLSAALNTCSTDATYSDLADLLRDKVSRDSPDQTPQLHCASTTQYAKLLDGTAVAHEGSVEVRIEKNDRDEQVAFLQAGYTSMVTIGSVYELFPAGTHVFAGATSIGRATVKSVDTTESLLDVATTAKLDGVTRACARQILHNYGDNDIVVDTDSIKHLTGADRIISAVQVAPLVKKSPVDPSKWDLRISPEGSTRSNAPTFRIERREGYVLVKGTVDDLGPRVRAVIEGESRWRFIKSLENQDPESAVCVKFRVVPVDVETDDHGKVTKIVGIHQPRLAGSPATLLEGDHFMIELENTGHVKCYVTVLDLQIDGSIGPVWPRPHTLNADNALEPGQKLLVGGDSFGTPTPRWVFKATQPFGAESLKAIATDKPADFSPVITSPTRGTRDPKAVAAAMTWPIGRLLDAVATGRGIGSETDAVKPSDWATASVTFTVSARKTK